MSLQHVAGASRAVRPGCATNLVSHTMSSTTEYVPPKVWVNKPALGLLRMDRTGLEEQDAAR